MRTPQRTKYKEYKRQVYDLLDTEVWDSKNTQMCAMFINYVESSKRFWLKEKVWKFLLTLDVDPFKYLRRAKNELFILTMLKEAKGGPK